MEIKEMVARARVAQKEYEERFNQEKADQAVKIALMTINKNAEMLARIAVDETQMGVYEHKVAKNLGKSKGVWYNLRDKKSMGILSICERTGMIEVAKPIGVLAGITPMTNPIVTPMSKIAFALKTKNAIIIAPHPKAKMCSSKAVNMIKEAIAPLGVPADLIQVIDEPSIEKTQELMKSVDVIVATGGMPMVHSAYSSGKPSFGVGAGNVQVILDRNINYDEAADKVITGRAFDNGIICSGEQFFVYPKENREEVLAAFSRHGAYIVPEGDRDKVINAIFDDGKIDRDSVGQSAEFIAKKAGITVPAGTRILIVEAKGIAHADMICREKMCPVMGCFGYDHFEEGLQMIKANLDMEGSGHTAAVHSNDQGNIIKTGNVMCVSRVVVNAVSATTAGGHIQNGLAVTNTLGCGTWGNNSISENFTYKHMLNITR
ncbi:aldehyde dehydrogenase family protein, partial [Porphyromonas sp.]|uniref:aldehyde dehydrogenase family protein n=1 Tax=Porphyromonas sp. TaxID=1924944 RepID=UPI0026DD49AF